MNSPYHLTILNPQIELKRDQNGKTYFLIRDQTTGIAYFAFPSQVKGWYGLVTKYPKAKEVHLQFRNDPKKITSLKILTQKEIRKQNRREKA